MGGVSASASSAGSAQLAPFLEGIEDYVREVVGQGWGRRPRGAARERPQSGAPPRSAAGDRPTAQPRRAGTRRRTLASSLHDAPSASTRFRPIRRRSAARSIDGKDVLLVMPTGVGQVALLPAAGLARGGTTLVISPLIALMEDQVAKLQALGFAVGAHPLRPRPRRLARRSASTT